MIAIIFRILGGAHHRKSIAVLLSIALACVLVGAYLFSLTQGIAFTKGIYWAITTATTVGYGDVTPHNGIGEVIASAVMLTTIPLLASVFALVTGAAAAAGIRRVLAMRDHIDEGHRLVVGMDGPVPVILDELVRVGEHVVLVADVDPATVRSEVHVIRGDPTQAHSLTLAHPERATQALIASDSDGDVLVSAVLLRRIAPDLEIVALVKSPSVREALHELGVSRTMSPADMIAHTIAKSLEAPHAADMLAQLVESDEHSLTEAKADAHTVGRPLSAVRDERAGLVLGLVHNGTFTLGIGDDPVVADGDYLLLAEPLPAHRA
ncbi:MAG TPA: potassium channel family protein [Streptosporangiaceae bacterium]|jgi:voltage-gated potassium channel|nr:potassium channel family protein [Streptosporangiaceae bacterium]